MAHKDIEWAYTLTLPASQKAVLLALAHCRNGKNGKCFPSQKELVSMTGLSLASVKRSLDVLDEDRVISRTKTVKGRYRSNDEYTLNHEYGSEQPQLTVTPAHSDPGSHSQKVGLTQSKSGAHSERAVVPTGIQPEVNRKVAAQRGTRIPNDFTVTTAMVTWARERTPLVDGPRSTEKFIDHWTAATGRNATKLDWVATWRNWLRTDQERAEKTPGRKQTPEDRMRATLALVLDDTPKEISA